MHWKKLINPDYLGAYSLEKDGAYQNIIVQIESVGMQGVTGQGGKVDQCVVAQLKGSKPMILNRTNMKRIEKVLKTPDINQWSGKQIELCVEVDKTHGDVLRVFPKPVTLPELTPEHKHWEVIKKGLADGKTTVAALRGKYSINSETEKLLTDGKG